MRRNLRDCNGTSTWSDQALVESLIGSADDNQREVCQIELFGRYRSRMASAARQTGLAPHLVDDVVQAAWMSAMDRIDTLRNPAAFPLWVSRITKNEAFNYLRQQGREMPISPEAIEYGAVPPAPDPAELFIRDESHSALRRAFEELKPADAALLDLLFVQEVSYKSAAQRLGWRPGSVGPRRGRSLDRLRKAYAKAS